MFEHVRCVSLLTRSVRCLAALLVHTVLSAGAGFSADSGLAVYADIAKVKAYEALNLEYHDICTPDWGDRFPELFYGSPASNLPLCTSTRMAGPGHVRRVRVFGNVGMLLLPVRCAGQRGSAAVQQHTHAFATYTRRGACGLVNACANRLLELCGYRPMAPGRFLGAVLQCT